MRSKLLILIFVMIFLATAVNAFVISGQVTDTDTNPINGSQIDVYDASNVLVNSTTTNATGDYSLEVGNLLRIVNASATGYDSQSTPIFVDSNKTINFVLGPIQAVYLSGYVTNSSDPLNNVDIKVKQGGATFTETNTNAAGFYNVGVVDGDNYDVTASLVGYDSNTSSVIINGSTELNLTLTKTPPSGCVENWSCTSWSGCSGSTQTRTCTDSNSCGTQINKPSESRSCNDDGGGSGGYDGTTYNIELTSAGSTKRLRKKDSVRFYFKGERHEVEVKKIETPSVNLLIESDPISATLDIGQTGKYDLNKDDVFDLKIDVDDIAYSRTTLSFYLINEPKFAQTTTTATTTTQTYTPPPPPRPKKEVIVEDVIPQEDNETVTTPSMFASAVGFIKKIPSSIFGAIKKIPYVGYAAAGVIVLAIIIVAMKLFKSEEEVEESDLGGYDKDQLKRRIDRLEKQIVRLKKTL